MSRKSNTPAPIRTKNQTNTKRERKEAHNVKRTAWDHESEAYLDFAPIARERQSEMDSRS